MNLDTLGSIIRLPYTIKEIRHRGWKHNGYHVFLSMYFFRFKSLKVIEKGYLMVSSGAWDPPSDVILLYSTLSTPTRKYDKIIRVVSYHWRSFTYQLKCWRSRVTLLNSCLISGRYNRVPDIFEDFFPDEICGSFTLG